MGPMTIGQVARCSGAGVEAIRFYGRQGLIPEPPRTSAGYRQYPPETVARLRFIRRAKELGFSLHEIGELIALGLDGNACAADVRAQAETKTRDIERKIRDLQRMHSSLATLIDSCAGTGTTDECPILHAMTRRDSDA